MNVKNLSPRIVLLALLALLVSLSARAADPIPLRAGPLRMIFEPDNAFLRYVRIGQNEVLRGINAPIRNELWGTVKPVVSNIQHRAEPNQFVLTFDALCRERDIDFMWRGTLTGSAEGVVEFGFEGTARSTFKRNRIGFCVLHAASAAGKPWIIERIDGKTSEGAFPEYISPHQPAKEIRQIAHQLTPDLWAYVRMAGETFEMEDQRNWTDASFKTYCTPLGIPYPVVVEKGTKISQKVTIRLEGDVAKYRPRTNGTDDAVTLTLNKNETSLPRIGLQVSSEIDRLSETEVARLKRLRLDHLRADLLPADEDFAVKLRDATKQAQTLGVGLHLGLRLGANPDAELSRVRTAVTENRPPVKMWFIIGATPEQFRLARQTLSKVKAGALFGAPRDGISFTELNRERPLEDMMEVVAYNVTPQIHASDNASIVETLPIQGDTVRSVRQFVGNAPLVISPVTFHTALAGADPLPGELPWFVDARQTGLFAAGWTVGSIKFLAEAGVHSTTYYETVGWRGIMDSASPPDRPDLFRSRPGEVYPIYHVLRDVADFSGGHVSGFNSSDDLSVVGLALRKNNRARFLIANLTARAQSAIVEGVGTTAALVRALDAKSVAAANKDPETFSGLAGKNRSLNQSILMEPHAIVRVDYSD